MKEKEFLPAVKERLGIENLNPMQEKMMATASEGRDTILLSPTGTGKTLAFALPLLKLLKPSTGRVQAVVIAPSRELVLQTADVLKKIAIGFKTTPLYGGHNVEDEVNSLSTGTDIIVATPGRLLDHSRRKNIELLPTRICVLDEFDKSLELGFEEDMKKIFNRLKNLSRIILTSATDMEVLPDFLHLKNPLTISFLNESEEVRSRMKIHRVNSDSKDKLQSLIGLLHFIKERSENFGKTIIFANHRESAERIYEFLRKNNVDAVLYHGGIDQIKREMAVSMFNNGSRPLLVATDLAARGLDISGVNNVIHYHLPLNQETFTHRNGRSARVDATGEIFLLVGPEEKLEPYIHPDNTFTPENHEKGEILSSLTTLYIASGKKEKLSKGDILGFLTTQEEIPSKAIGKINVYDHYSLVAIEKEYAKRLLSKGRNFRIKGQNRRITQV